MVLHHAYTEGMGKTMNVERVTVGDVISSNGTTTAEATTATEAIDADLAELIERLCKESASIGLAESAVAEVARVTRKAYMEGWYRGHQCASDLAARIDREMREAREASRIM